MTGADEETTPGRRSAAWRWGTPVAGVLIGVLFVSSAVSSDGIDLRPQRYQDLAGLAQAETEEYDALEARVNELDAQIEDLTSNVDDGRVEQLQTQADQLHDPAGMTPRSGSGIRVTLSDGPKDLMDVAVERHASDNPEDREYPKPNWYVVHQQDIQAVVNAMWVGGAEAITIAGQRVVSTTGIRCRGSVVQLQGRPYPQPFVIEAVGDQEEIAESVRADPWVQIYMSDAEDERIQKGWDLEGVEEIQAPAFEGLIDHQYAEPLA
ncbi:DUF881 domain-containing protein [Nocardioides panacisoli]|uniref:DUF881 domain-containing protein n=1 Tax=Nocardioides panacisoli TaxID=627624 RepID=UPI001C62F308|nr:DUF881 domain-containing protein [Nocardioides panacisoli]QYJ03234.1 DUF881 domain-containing protein [Nocardioides panacisoli]